MDEIETLEWLMGKQRDRLKAIHISIRKGTDDSVVVDYLERTEIELRETCATLAELKLMGFKWWK